MNFGCGKNENITIRSIEQSYQTVHGGSSEFAVLSKSTADERLGDSDNGRSGRVETVVGRPRVPSYISVPTLYNCELRERSMISTYGSVYERPDGSGREECVEEGKRYYYYLYTIFTGNCSTRVGNYNIIKYVLFFGVCPPFKNLSPSSR